MVYNGIQEVCGSSRLAGFSSSDVEHVSVMDKSAFTDIFNEDVCT